MFGMKSIKKFFPNITFFLNTYTQKSIHPEFKKKI